MTWKSKLRPASFRGVRFFVDATDAEVGRKIQLHEYPKRDIPFAEDMGKVSRTYRFSAFVIGSDCFDQRDALLEALEKEGAGELVHPYLGTLSVKVGECKVKHARTEGGMVRFELLFYPGDELSAPGTSVNTAQSIRWRGTSFIASAKNRFLNAMANVNIAGVNMNVLANSLSGVFEVASAEISAFAEIASDASSFAQLLTSNPQALANVMLDGIAEAYGFSGAVSETFESFNSITSSLDGITSSFEKTSVPNSGGDDTSKAAAAAACLVQDSLILKASGIASIAPVAVAPATITQTASIEQQMQTSVARDPVPVADDVIASRDQLSEVIWETAETEDTFDASHFEVTNDLRLAVESHLTEVAKSGVMLKQIGLPEQLPALVIAWRQFQDATREVEVCQRNAVVHPGFIADSEIWIASK